MENIGLGRHAPSAKSEEYNVPCTHTCTVVRVLYVFPGLNIFVRLRISAESQKI